MLENYLRYTLILKFCFGYLTTMAILVRVSGEEIRIDRFLLLQKQNGEWIWQWVINLAYSCTFMKSIWKRVVNIQSPFLAIGFER